EKQKSTEMIEQCIDFANLTEQKDKKVGALSGGMLRRLGIAQALLNNPKLLIFDEPTAGLDPMERLRFKSIVSEIEKDKITIISTHIV
ncbi:ATP-binding cassette domain-containing protein, partial [Acinetobacter baumannii]|nr:ATP-binding cassette domain-containing protein [Acinetobacter baumannii]